MAVTPKIALEHPVTPSADSARVFVSYKRSADPDERMAQQIVASLGQAGHDVFIDRHMLVGVQWAEEIERQIRRADFLVVLLTAASCRSEGLLGEIDKARKHFADTGKPRILPVRLAFLGDLPYPVNGWLDGVQYALWRGDEETPAVIEQLTAAIQSKTQLPKRDGCEPQKTTTRPTILLPCPGLAELLRWKIRCGLPGQRISGPSRSLLSQVKRSS